MNFLEALHPDVVVPTKRSNVIFIHHSVGESLIRDGSVRQILTKAGFDFWDHGYNNEKLGLINAKGESSGCYWIPEDNTNPDGLSRLFTLNPRDENAFSKILNNHDIIIFKSCFPVSQISENNILKDLIDPGRKSLYNYKRHYLKIRDTIDKHSEKIFIIVTQPPMHPNATNTGEARRARAFVEWLKSKEYLGDRKNLFVFDYFNLLADSQTNMLRTEYQIDTKGKNSHPNPIAQMVIGPQFADFIINVVTQELHSNLAQVAFDNKEWPSRLVRLNKPTVTLDGRVMSKNGIKKILWTDLRRQEGTISANEAWKIHNITVDPGITKVIVTVIDNKGLRSSSVIGLQYYSGKASDAVIFDGFLKRGMLDGLAYSDEYPSDGKLKLVINGTGNPQRVAIQGLNIDISDFDPEKTYLEIYYDQGMDISQPELLIQGVGLITFNVDNKKGYEKIIIPFDKFLYVQNTFDNIIFKGKWSKNTKVYIQSLRLVCIGKKNT